MNIFVNTKFIERSQKIISTISLKFLKFHWNWLVSLNLPGLAPSRASQSPVMSPRRARVTPVQVSTPGNLWVGFRSWNFWSPEGFIKIFLKKISMESLINGAMMFLFQGTISNFDVSFWGCAYWKWHVSFKAGFWFMMWISGFTLWKPPMSDNWVLIWCEMYLFFHGFSLFRAILYDHVGPGQSPCIPFVKGGDNHPKNSSISSRHLGKMISMLTNLLFQVGWNQHLRIPFEMCFFKEYFDF